MNSLLDWNTECREKDCAIHYRREALKFICSGRNDTYRKIANNTHVVLQKNGDIAIQLHSTNIVTFTVDGDVVLDSGGWKTPTTKQRMTLFSPVSVYSNKGVWYCHDKNDRDEVIEFYNGIRFRYRYLRKNAKRIKAIRRRRGIIR